MPLTKSGSHALSRFLGSTTNVLQPSLSFILHAFPEVSNALGPRATISRCPSAHPFAPCSQQNPFHYLIPVGCHLTLSCLRLLSHLPPVQSGLLSPSEHARLFHVSLDECRRLIGPYQLASVVMTRASPSFPISRTSFFATQTGFGLHDTQIPMMCCLGTLTLERLTSASTRRTHSLGTFHVAGVATNYGEGSAGTMRDSATEESPDLVHWRRGRVLTGTRNYTNRRRKVCARCPCVMPSRLSMRTLYMYQRKYASVLRN